MQKSRFIAVAVFAIVLSILAPGSALGQYTSREGFGKELRPFDFSDQYYKKNGVDPGAILNRRTGFDHFSVVDFIESDVHRNVRITGTWPMDDYRGEMFFAAPLGELTVDGFTEDDAGVKARELAHRYPYYVFPSVEFRGTNRQAAVAETGFGYYDENPLGISVMISVEYTKKGASEEGQKRVKSIVGPNGLTLDGTVALRTVSEINRLAWMGLVSQKLQSEGGRNVAAYKLKQVITDPRNGAISPDATLFMVLDQNQAPLRSELVFVEQFECLQRYGGWCR